MKVYSSLSIPVEIDEYFIPLLRYIHQNPLKARLVAKMEDYEFSSYRKYLYGGNLTNTTFSYSMVGKDEWIRLHKVSEEGDFDVSGKASMSEAQIRRKYCGVQRKGAVRSRVLA